MMATLVRYHRKAIKLDDMPRFTLFKKKTVSAVNSATSAGRITEQPAAGRPLRRRRCD
ncbi:exopolyphosphatase [Salmonella enterica subsp. enterica]|uniref:Exopolyphosphatase n=1 Tax=Salmonella enterica I TaxID=59201 RepID=A0A3S4LVU2_SALET|nr:exopolyphosphatase [Salmonella enterica subsp. enterica]